MAGSKELTTVLITGATGGIGRALAHAYARKGRRLILHGRDDTKLQELSAECTAQGASVRLLSCDLADSDVWRDALHQVCRSEAVDLAIVNAGVASTVPAGEQESWGDIQSTMDINLRAAMATTHVIASIMAKRGHGQIALVSSLAAFVGMPLSPSYCASKSGLKAYGEAMRGLMSTHGVGVTVVLPGFVETAMSNRYPASRPFMVSPDWAARRIRDALPGNPARISFPQPLAFAMWSLSVMPAAWAQWVLSRLGYAAARQAKPDAGGD